MRGEAYPLMSSRKLLGGSLFPSAENVAPTHAFFFLCQGVRCAGSEKIILGSASTEASPCGIFSAPPLDTERKQPHPAPFFPITCSEMNSPRGIRIPPCCFPKNPVRETPSRAQELFWCLQSAPFGVSLRVTSCARFNWKKGTLVLWHVPTSICVN